MGTSSWLFSVWLRPPTPPLRPRLTPTFCTEATAVWDTLDTSDTEVSMEATDTSDTLPLPWLEATLPTLLPPPCTSEVLPPSPLSPEDMPELDVTVPTLPESCTAPKESAKLSRLVFVEIFEQT